MAYVDFDFYKTEYHGSAVPESDFNRLAELASDEIDLMTNDRLTDTTWLNSKQLKKVQRACCALAENIYYDGLLRETALSTVGTDESGRSKVVSSITSGSESISYATGGTNANSLEGQALQKAMSDNKTKARRYLSDIKYKDKGYYILAQGVGLE